jgi:hypothetical protein
MANNLLALPIALLALVALPACSPEGGGGKTTDTGDDGGGGDDGGDDGGEETWYAGGIGTAYFLDGTTDGSVFHLEMQAVPQPREGQNYYGWLSNTAGDTLPLGEIAVPSADITLETDLGVNALLEGFTNFTAYMGTGDDANVSGELLWVGIVDPELEDAYQQLLLTTPETPGEEGSVRAVQTTVETVLNLAQDTIDNVSDLAVLQSRSEQISNALTGLGEDLKPDGNAETIDGVMAVLGDDGVAELILSDLDQASASVEPLHPVKDLANWSYDCTQRVQAFADDAANRAAIATAAAGIDQGKARLEDAVENLNWALEGRDENEDGEINLIDEGTIGCAVYYINQMAYLEVSVPAVE